MKGQASFAPNGPYERLYAGTPSLWRGHVGEMVEAFCQTVARSPISGEGVPRAIDLGAGEGDNAIYLAEHGYHVHLVEMSPSAIVHFERRLAALPDSIQRRLSHERRRVEARLLDARYDLIVAYGLLHCFPTAEEAIEIARSCATALTPNGYLIVSALTNGVLIDADAHPELKDCHLPSVLELRGWFQNLVEVKGEVERFEETHDKKTWHSHEVFRGIFRSC